MTQALLNETNKVIDGIYSSGNSFSSYVTKNFNNILHSKSYTNKSELKKQVQTALNAGNTKIQSYKQIGRNNFISDIDDSYSEEIEALCETFFDKASEAVIEETLNDEEDELLTEELMTEDLIPESITQTTITDEETTMQKELAFENPAATTFLMNLQINQINNNTDENTQLTESENTLVLEKNNYSETSSEKEVFESIKISLDKENQTLQDDKKSLHDIIDSEIIDDLNIESVSSDSLSSGSDFESFMQNSAAQEQITKMMIQGKNYAELKTGTEFSLSAKQEITSDKIIEQITKQMDGMYNSSKVNIVLNPESLGRMTLHLLNTKSGLSAQFIVSNEDVRNLLMKGLNELKETLLSHGVNVDNVSIKLNESEMQKDDSQEDWTEQEGSRGGNKHQNSKQQKQEEKPFEQTMFEINNKEV